MVMLYFSVGILGPCDVSVSADGSHSTSSSIGPMVTMESFSSLSFVSPSSSFRESSFTKSKISTNRLISSKASYSRNMYSSIKITKAGSAAPISSTYMGKSTESTSDLEMVTSSHTSFAFGKGKIL